MTPATGSPEVHPRCVSAPLNNDHFVLACLSAVVGEPADLGREFDTDAECQVVAGNGVVEEVVAIRLRDAVVCRDRWSRHIAGPGRLQ